MPRAQSPEPGAYLRAREAREVLIRRALADGPQTVVTLSLNIPGPDKHLPGCSTVFACGALALESALGGSSTRISLAVPDGTEVLGHFGIWRTPLEPRAVKYLTIEIEDGPSGRLLDLDVYDEAGYPMDRARVGRGPRPCFVCPEPAHECARLARHSAGQLASALATLLGEAFLDALAVALVAGSREELELTPKPGLVDREDQGSHPDLTFESMSRSLDLLPQYFRELRQVLSAWGRIEPDPIEECVRAGQRAERRMRDEVGSNAHRGYIFLAGLALVAAAPDPPRNVAEYRRRITTVAPAVLAVNREAGEPGPGAKLRQLHGLAGIHGEARAGLPAIFEHARPAFRRAQGMGRDRRAAAHYAMAILMQHLEDTTAVHRAGMAGLDRLRHDGRRIQQAIESGGNHHGLLRTLNAEYRGMRLTMGGVADCLALTMALEGMGIILPDDETA